MPLDTAQRPMASTSSRGYTAPVGLDGDTKSNALVLGVQASSRSSTLERNPVASSERPYPGVPPASWIDSGYVVQYGASTMTSSPGSHSTANALETACLPPLVTST